MKKKGCHLIKKFCLFIFQDEKNYFTVLRLLFYKFHAWPVLLSEMFKLAELGGSNENDMRAWLIITNLYKSLKERIEMIHAENIDDFQ